MWWKVAFEPGAECAMSGLRLHMQQFRQAVSRPVPSALQDEKRVAVKRRLLPQADSDRRKGGTALIRPLQPMCCKGFFVF